MVVKIKKKTNYKPLFLLSYVGQMWQKKQSKKIQVVDLEKAQLIGTNTPVVQYDESNKQTEIILFVVGLFMPLVMWVFVCCVGAKSKTGRTLRTVGIVLTVLQVLGIIGMAILTGLSMATD